MDEERPLCKCHGEPMGVCRRQNGKVQWKCRVKARQRNRRWEAENPEKVRDSKRKWEAENLEKVRERRRKWQSENKERRRESCRKWRAKKLRQGLCSRCGKKPLLTEALCWDCLDKQEKINHFNRHASCGHNTPELPENAKLICLP